MTLEELAYISQIIGVVAVLASLIFVGVQAPAASCAAASQLSAAAA